MEISCVRLIRDGNNTRHWFLIAMKLIWTIILTVVSTTTTCSNRWVSLIILLGRFAISPLSQPPARYTIQPRVTKSPFLCNYCQYSFCNYLQYNLCPSCSYYFWPPPHPGVAWVAILIPCISPISAFNAFVTSWCCLTRRTPRKSGASMNTCNEKCVNDKSLHMICKTPLTKKSP